MSEEYISNQKFVWKRRVKMVKEREDLERFDVESPGRNILGFLALMIALFIGGVIVMTILGLDLVSAFGAVAATLNNIGPGLGSVGPTDNYAHIPMIGKWVLTFFMLAGRLEIYTVLILFAPAFWKK